MTHEKLNEFRTTEVDEEQVRGRSSQTGGRAQKVQEDTVQGIGIRSVVVFEGA